MPVGTRASRCTQGIRDELSQLREADLSPDERIDRALVVEALDAMAFDDAELRELAWDALGVVRSAGGGFFSLLAREFAPWQHRGAAFAARMRSLPEFLRAAADGLSGLDGRPVSELHAKVALAQLTGISDLIDQGLAEADRRASETDGHEIADEMRAAESGARAADRRLPASAQRRDPAARTGRGSPGVRSFRQEAAPHAGERPHACGDCLSGAARLRPHPRRDAAPGARLVERILSRRNPYRTATTRPSAVSSTPSRASTRSRTS